MKRIVTYRVVDGKNKISSISAPISENKIDFEKLLEDGYGLIDADYSKPLSIPGKKMELYYDAETQTIECEYFDLEFSDLPPMTQISQLNEQLTAVTKENKSLTNSVKTLKSDNKTLNSTIDELKAQNEALQSELELTQLSLFELVEMVVSE